MIIVYFMIYIYISLNSGESSLSIFRIAPYSDITASANIATVSLIERHRGIISPSFLGTLETSSISGSFWKDYIGFGYYNFLSYNHRLDYENGVNLFYYGYTSGKENVYYYDGSMENLVFEKDYMLGGGYGTRIYKNIFLGFKAKYISSTLAEKYSASTYALDMDFLINTPTRYIFRIGVENFGGSIKYLSAKEYLPNFFIAEISKYFNFRDLFLSIGFGFRKSKDYSSTSIAGEFSVRKFPLRVLGGYKKGVNLSRYFTGLGLLIENVYLSCSFEFPSILGSNGMKISFTYFFTTPNIFPSDYNNKYDIKNNQKLKKDIPSNYIDKTKEKKFSPLHQKNENYDVIIF